MTPPIKFSPKLFIPLVLFVVLTSLYSMLTVNVPADGFAVRQVLLGPNKGIQKDIMGAGLQLVIPSYERLHRYTRRIQLIDFNDKKDSSSDLGRYAPSIRIQTSEGYQVTVDVTVAYRIIDPYKVLVSVGPGSLYETALVRPRADRYLRESLGRLNAEDFYNGDKRLSASLVAREKLTKDLEPAGIQVWNVMVRHYTYDDRYQNAIEQRKIQDQTVFKNQAEALSAAEEAEKNRVLAEGQARVSVEAERGKAEVRKIDADADLYYRRTIAEGDKLVALAEAKGTKLENQALQAAGAGNIVGLEMAEALNGIEVVIVPTDGQNALNPLDLNSLIGGW
jgi:regulator of protease activity HflC (stomatin/prohibitin superfamily)